MQDYFCLTFAGIIIWSNRPTMRIQKIPKFFSYFQFFSFKVNLWIEVYFIKFEGLGNVAFSANCFSFHNIFYTYMGK